jgi:hypothetical protein
MAEDMAISDESIASRFIEAFRSNVHNEGWLLSLPSEVRDEVADYIRYFFGCRLNDLDDELLDYRSETMEDETAIRAFKNLMGIRVKIFALVTSERVKS